MTVMLECTFAINGAVFKTYWSPSQRKFTNYDMQPRFLPGLCIREGLSDFCGRWSKAKSLSEALASSQAERFEMEFFTPTVNPNQWYASVTAFVHNNFTTRTFTRSEAAAYIDNVLLELQELSKT